jgi:ubiquinone/menaquinone biosynthesis C-methylase UbiE
MSSEARTDFICINCKTELMLVSDTFHCGSCQQEYLVFDKVCLLVDKPMAYVAESYFLYKAHIRAQRNEVKKLKSYFEGKKEKAGIINNLIIAIEHNAGLVEQITKKLLPHVAPELLFQAQTNPTNQFSDYLKDFRYMRRDWVWDKEGELQLAIINQSLKETIQTSITQPTNVLVLGAGLGRIAYDLSDSFEKVYATDYSFSMAHFFQRLTCEEILFYEVNTNNIYSNTDYTRKLKASVSAPFNKQDSLTKDIRKVEYFIADVQRLPLKDKSVSCVVSAYFTDVLAWKLWFKEVKRVLKDGGLFIHFGPLGYPFGDVSERLSAESIKYQLLKDGFQICTDDRVSTKHLDSITSMETSLHSCWLLGARKEPTDTSLEPKQLTSLSVLAIAKELSYRITGQIGLTSLVHEADTETETTELIFDHDQVYTGAGVALVILKLINGRRNLEQIMEQLSVLYQIGETETDHIYRTIRDLIEKSIVKIN